MERFLFPKKLRLLNSHEFVHALKYAHKLKINNISLLFYQNKFKHPRLGIIITKKQIKQSYKRNQIKRYIRENFRLNQYIIPKMDFIIIIYKNIINLNQNLLQQTFKKIWTTIDITNYKTGHKTNIHLPTIY